MQLLRVLRLVCIEHPLRNDSIKVTDADSLAVHLLQELLSFCGRECLFNRRLQPREFLCLLNLDGSLFKSHCHPRTSNLWSGRRESNPRPTAWKAVTLPLSYSRPNTSCQLSAVSPSQSLRP